MLRFTQGKTNATVDVRIEGDLADLVDECLGGNFRTPMKRPCAQLTSIPLPVKFCSAQLTGKLAWRFEGRGFNMKQQFSIQFA